MCPELLFLLVATAQSSLVTLQQSSVWSHLNKVGATPALQMLHSPLANSKIENNNIIWLFAPHYKINANSPDTEVYYHWVAHTPLHIPMHHDCRSQQLHCRDFRYLERKIHPDWESSLACSVVFLSVLRLGRTCCLFFDLSAFFRGWGCLLSALIFSLACCSVAPRCCHVPLNFEHYWRGPLFFQRGSRFSQKEEPDIIYCEIRKNIIFIFLGCRLFNYSLKFCELSVCIHDRIIEYSFVYNISYHKKSPHPNSPSMMP